MRVNFAALACEPHTYGLSSVPVTVQVSPTRGMPGDHLYMTDSRALLNMLKRTTDLSGYVLEGFMQQLKTASSARLSSVEVSDRTLREIGYFVD